MKGVHISVAALLAALIGLSTGIANKNSEAVATSIVALVSVFLPAVQLVLPWFTSSPVKGEMPVFDNPPPSN